LEFGDGKRLAAPLAPQRFSADLILLGIAIDGVFVHHAVIHNDGQPEDKTFLDNLFRLGEAGRVTFL
jgi:hypothetical protein